MMKRHFQSSISALAISAMVMGGVVVSTIGLTAAPAFSKGSNSDNGKRNENSNDRGRPDGNRGAQASSLGALNAAHANAMALENTAENSRVGMIEIYKAAVIASADADVAVDDAKAALDLFVASCETLAVSATEQSVGEETVTLLTEAECLKLLTDATAEAQETADAKALADGVDPAPVNDVDYGAYVILLTGILADATTAATTFAELEEEALELAANRATDEEVIDALWDLLTLTDSLEPAPVVAE